MTEQPAASSGPGGPGLSEVVDVPQRGRFEVLLDGEVAGYTLYRDNGGERTFPHTEVDEGFQGRGLATVLIRAALDATRAAGLTVNPVCPAVRRFISREGAYLDIVPPARQAEHGLG